MLGIVLAGCAGCAGRDPQPVASVQQHDAVSDCTMIRAEIEANNARASNLANEQGWKVAQTSEPALLVW